jgi:hypothetical protein
MQKSIAMEANFDMRQRKRLSGASCLGRIPRGISATLVATKRMRVVEIAIASRPIDAGGGLAVAHGYRRPVANP